MGASTVARSCAWLTGTPERRKNSSPGATKWPRDTPLAYCTQGSPASVHVHSNAHFADTTLHSGLSPQVDLDLPLGAWEEGGTPALPGKANP